VKPKVSIILSVYNHEKFVEEAIRSSLEQTMDDLELIIVDDGSLDRSYEICARWQEKDGRVKLKKQRNTGLAAARNAGLEIARGDFFTILDSDDYMDKKALELMLEQFAKNPLYDVIYSAVKVVDEGGKVVDEIRNEGVRDTDFLAKMFLRSVMPNPNAILAKAKCFKDRRYKSSFPMAEDYFMMLELAHKYRFHYLDIPLRYYRRHGENMSGNLSGQRAGELGAVRSFGADHIVRVLRESSLEDKDLCIAKALYNLEEFEKAAPLFKVFNGSADALFYLGNCYFKSDKIEEAIANYSRSLVIDENNAACHNNLGVAYAKMGRFHDAKLCFEKALSLRSDYLDPKLNLAQIKSANNFTFRELRKDIMPYIF